MSQADGIMNPMEPDSATDRSGQILEATARLITTDVWRQRVVEQIKPLSADHYDLKRSFQFEVSSSLMDGLIDDDHVDTLLPVCWMPKYAMLDFDLTTAGGESLAVLERRSNAGALSEILDAWRCSIDSLADVELDQSVIESVCAASLSPWQTQLAASDEPSADEALLRYLETSLFRIHPADADRFLKRGRSLSQQTFLQIDQSRRTEDDDNTFCCGALLAPYFVPRPETRQDLLQRIDSHHDCVQEVLQIAQEDEDAREWLCLIAEAGNRWPLLTRMRIPVDTPFLIKLRETRRSGDADPHLFVHRADLQAARSYHLRVAAPDATTRISKLPTATAANGAPVATPDPLESVRWTEELFTTYTSREERPQEAIFRIRFGLNRQAQLSYGFAWVIILAAVLTAVGIGDLQPDMAAVLTIPTSIVSGFLLTRDTPLMARFQRVQRFGLVIANSFLWIYVLWRLVIE